MTMKIKWISLLFISVLLTGCFGLFDSGTKRITGKYIVVWIDLSRNQGIDEEIEGSPGSSIGLVPEYVFAVGHNKDYIIAKQHPTSGFENGFEIDTTITNYYLIDMNAQKDKVIGPMTKSRFDSTRIALKIQNIEFDMIFKENP
ncbi:MAG: DUF3997 domain-containing protein [Breznakibacter sp.]